MSPNRRDFVRLTGTVAAAAGLGFVRPSLAEARPDGSPRSSGPVSPRAAHPLRILILGGTSFIGPHQVDYALSRGHEITLFNRGRTNTHLFPEVEKLRGDRNGDLESLKGRTWDVVFDNSASNYRWVQMSAEVLKDSVDLYFYVSSRSAYVTWDRVPMTADAPTNTFESMGVSTDAERLPYGLQKALCEREAQAAFPGRTCIFRPGLIIGPRDTTDRFTYWPVRIHRGGEVLAPGDPSDPIQIIDARDFSEWMVRMAESSHTGVYNVVGPRTPRPIAEMLYGIRAVTTAETTFTWVPRDFLFENEVRPYSDMPVWMPPIPGREGFARFDLSAEVERGLTFRPLAVTAKETLEYHFSRPPERQAQLRAGMSAERESDVLSAWHRSGRAG